MAGVASLVEEVVVVVVVAVSGATGVAGAAGSAGAGGAGGNPDDLRLLMHTSVSGCYYRWFIGMAGRLVSTGSTVRVQM